MKLLGAVSRYSNTPIDVIVGINTTERPSRKEGMGHASGAPSVDFSTPYYPLEPTSMDHPTSLRQGLLAVLAILRASHHLYWTAHWQAKGNNFYDDHLLFERLYKGRLEEIDQVSEISVSLFGPGAVDAITTWEAARLVIDEFSRVDCLICNFITLEKSFQELIGKVLPLAKAEQPGGGVENLLTTVAQTHLQNEYLLQGRDRK